MKILMLEDNPTDADLVRRELSRNRLEFKSECVAEEDEFIHALYEFKPDVILSDHALPQFNSMAALKIAKKISPDSPFILVTGSVSEEFAASCIKSGADDYILKTNLSRLTAAIHSSLERRKLEMENMVVKNLNYEVKKKNAELEYLNKEKDRFVGMVSHDLQNHVSSMMHTLSLCEMNNGGVAEKQMDCIRKLNRSTSNMHRLLNDFLTINRIQSGIIQPVYSLVSLGGLVDDVLQGYEFLAQRKEIKLTYTNNCEDSFFRTDLSYVGIIADNLISNAIKYTNNGGEVNIEVSKKEGKYNLKVKDSGLGIPEADMKKLYRRFEKLTPKPTGGEPSNGLGLSIVKDLVSALGGTIECESKVGQGTTFNVTF